MIDRRTFHKLAALSGLGSITGLSDMIGPLSSLSFGDGAATDMPAAPAVSIHQIGNTVTLSNRFVQFTFDRMSHRVIHLSADHTGAAHFRSELLAPEGISFAANRGSGPAEVQIKDSSPQHVSAGFRWAEVGSGTGAVVDLMFTLRPHDRGVQISASLPHGEAIRLMLRQWFLLAIFERGVVQYVAGQSQHFTSTDPLRLFYTMSTSNGSVAVEPEPGISSAEVSLLSGADAAQSGIVLRTRTSSEVKDDWSDGEITDTAASGQQDRTTIAFRLYANDLPYPAHREDSRIHAMDAAHQRQWAAYFTATYGSAAGVLGSYQEPGSAYPTLAHPTRAYGEAFNFFDPDAWETVTTLAYSGDPLLQIEARRVLERSESAQLPNGQIPHHFNRGIPTYLSIAGSSQTGPNIFYVLAASEYAAATGDEQWLRGHYVHLRGATDWLLTRYNPRMRLLHADGPLFIDVFRRSGFTLDTNTVALYLLDRMSEVADFCDDPAAMKRYTHMRDNLRAGLVQELWNGDDHFITERHTDGTTRDFGDYDGNFAALAFGVLTNDRDRRRLLSRLENGPHLHPGGYGTWVSERSYGKQDCYGGNVGDSDVTMARIWWLDMAARVQMADWTTFHSLLKRVQDTILRDVWLPERYSAQGQPAHNPYYHEYPEVFSMILRTMLYGVQVGMRKVAIRPFRAQPFSLHLGSLHIEYTDLRVALTVPGSSEREFTIAGLIPDSRYMLSTGQGMTTDAQGKLNFHAHAGSRIVLSRDNPARI